MLSRDFAGGLAAIVLGSLYLYFAFQQRVSALADTIGPAGMPKVLGILMIALGLVLCLQALYQTYRLKVADSRQWQGQGRKLLRAAGLLCLAIAYLLVVSYLGYALSIAILLCIVALYLGAKPGWQLGLVALGGATMLWAIFVIVLGVQMPAGMLLQG